MARSLSLACTMGLLIASACSDVELRPAMGALRLIPGELDFPETAIGHERDLPLQVQNVGRFDVEVAVEAEAPFSAAGLFQIPAGGSREVRIRFSPTRGGSFEGAVRVHGDGLAAEASLRGVGVEPSCAPAAACEALKIEADGSCAYEPLPEDLACSDLCIPEGVCLSGACRGTPLSCDDGDPCTIDSCDPLTGCTHAPKQCPVANRCQVPTCDPVAGCGVVNALDGTACDDQMGCDTRGICIAGTCRDVPVADGTLCRPESPCQGPGYCNAGKCVGPAKQELLSNSVARVSSHSGVGFLFDEGGTTIKSSSNPFVGDSFSGVTLDGGVRWGAPGTALLHQGWVFALVDNSYSSEVTAWDPIDGSLQWSVPVADLVPSSALSGPDLRLTTGGMAVDSQDRLMLNVSVIKRVPVIECVSSWRVIIDPLTGSFTRMARPNCTLGEGLASSGTGNEYSIEYGSAQTEIENFGSAGNSWEVAWKPGRFFGAVGGYLFISSREDCREAPSLKIVDASTHTPILDTGVLATSVVGNEKTVFVLGRIRRPADPNGPCLDHPETEEPVLLIVHPLTGSIITAKLPAGYSGVSSGLALTDRESVVLVASGPADGSGALIEINESGAVVFECPTFVGYPVSVMLADDRVFLTTHWSSSSSVFELETPGLQPARHGWIGPLGDNAGRFRALP